MVASATVALAITLGSAAPAQATPGTTPVSASGTATETIHTTANHPWLTADRGWVEAGQLKPGESVVTLSGATETVAWVHTVAGQADMYNLTVAQDHTYAVGDGQYVVHNVGEGCIGDKLPTWTKGNPTEGYLDTGAGDPAYIRSGSGGPADSMPEGTPGYINVNPG